MKNNLILFSFFLAAFISCKKDTVDTSNENVLVNNEVMLPKNCAGAFYAIRYFITTDSNAFHPNLTYSTCYTKAWFNNPDSATNIGNISFNGQPMAFSKDSIYYTVKNPEYRWYENEQKLSNQYFNAPNYNVNWEIVGDTAKGFLPFTYIDTIPFGEISYINCPNSASFNTGFNFNFAHYIHPGISEQKTFTIYGGGNSFSDVASLPVRYTVTNEILKKVTYSGGNVTVGIAYVSVDKRTINGKLYCFIKQCFTTKGVHIY